MGWGGVGWGGGVGGGVVINGPGFHPELAP